MSVRNVRNIWSWARGGAFIVNGQVGLFGMSRNLIWGASQPHWGHRRITVLVYSYVSSREYCVECSELIDRSTGTEYKEVDAVGKGDCLGYLLVYYAAGEDILHIPLGLETAPQTSW